MFQNLQSYFGETLAPIGAAVLGTALLAFVFGLARYGLKKLRPLAEKTTTKLDDAALDAVEEAAEIAERDAQRRLNLTSKK